jgi:hypothetical protein
MRKVLIAAASAALLSPLLAISPALATVNDQSLCDNASVGLCLNDANGASNGGNPIIMYTLDNDDSQYTTFPTPPPNDLCSGVVSANCPFTGAAKGLDSNYSGDNIVEIKFPQVKGGNGCAGLASGNEVALESCSDSNSTSLWVEAHYSGIYSSFVNVGWTNEQAGSDDGEPLVLTGSTTSGAQATVTQWVANGEQQWEWAGNIPPP